MKGIRKSTFREIRASFGRFMAIFAIIALGVGFFAGLSVTKGAMTVTVREYLNGHDFYDFQLVSTLGFEPEDVAFLADEGDAEKVEGAVSFDILYRMEDGRQGVVKTYSLNGVNTPKLISGRMPQRGDECLADSMLFAESDIGSLLYLSENNEEEDLEHFSSPAYTIVGLVQSPLYLQYERGNTSLGTGRLDGFIYLMEHGFQTDYFTEIDVRFDQDYDLYSEEYKDFIQEKESVWESLTEEAALRRYQDIRGEAEEKLADARKEFEEKKAEGETELADAAQELADARQELADGEQALADAREELTDGEQTLKEKEQELADARDIVATKEKELADAFDTVAEKEAELADGERELAAGEEELRDNEKVLEAAKSEIAGNRAALDGQAEQLAKQKAGLEAMGAAGMISEQELAAGLAAVAEGEKELAAGRAKLDEAAQELAEADREMAEAREQIAEGDQELADGRAALAEARQELADGAKELEDARKEIADGETALEDARKELEEARETLAEKEEELADAKRQVAEGEQEYQDALKEFDEKIAEAEEELADAEGEIADLKEPDTYVLGRDTNVGYVCFENDANIVAGIANIFPLFFFLVAALVCITTMNRMVEEQRTQIGVLKALGYGNAAIMSKYMIYSGLAAVTGCTFGFFLGTWGFPKIIWFCYGIMYQADPISYLFDWKLAVISMTVSLLCSIGTTWLSCRVELTQVAAALMRPKAPKAGKRVFLEYLPFLWKRFDFLRKVSLRNIFRYKKRLFMMVVGISGCTALLVTGFGIKDSIADVAARQFEEIQIYDIGVTLKDSADDAFLEELSGLQRFGLGAYTCIMEKNMDFVSPDGTKSVYLVAGTADEMPKFLNLHTQGGEEISYPEQGKAVISNKLAEMYDVKAGDRITLRDENLHSLTVEVAAIYENYLYNYVHISEDTWRELMGEEPERKTVYLNLTGDAGTAHELSAELMKLEGVTNVTVNADTMERIGSMMASLDIIVVVVIFCAAGLAFIVLYNLTNINITERMREIATIKVLGFYKNETASYVFRENIMLTVLGMALGLGLGCLLHRLVMNEIQVDLVSFTIYIKPVSYLYSAFLTLAFAWFVDKVMEGKLENISMTESLKSVD